MRVRKENEQMMSTGEKKEGSGIKVLFMAFVASLIVFIVLVVVERMILNKDIEKQTVIMTKADSGVLAAGSYIPAGQYNIYFVEKEIEKSIAPVNALTDIKQLGEYCYVSCDVGGNVIITSDMLTNRVSDVSSIDNPVQVSFSVESISNAVAGTIRQGDIISLGTVYMNEVNEYENMPIVDAVIVDQAYTSEGLIASSIDGNEATLFTVTLPKDVIEPFFSACANGTLVVGKVVD